MPWGLKRFQEARCLHFLTFSCYHRAPLFNMPSARNIFEQTLEQVRRWYGFYICGYVVMPEHVHLLVSEPERKKLSVALQMLKQNVAQRMHRPCLSGFSKDRAGKFPNSTKLLAYDPFWQARYYDFNVWTEAKRIEKLHYMHCNPVKRGLVQNPEDWPWSSFRHYISGVEGAVEIESQWTARKREQMGLSLRLVGPDQNPRPVSPKTGETRTGHPQE
jgi:putative transposase